MAGPDLSAVTGAVDFATTLGAVLGVGAALVVVYVAWKGALMVLDAVRGGVWVGNDGREYTGRELDRIWESMDSQERDAWGFKSKSDFYDSV